VRETRQRIAAASLVMVLRRATGMRVLDCKRVLEYSEQNLYEKLVTAMHTQAEKHYFHDPIEDEPQTGMLARAAFAEAERELSDEKRTLGFCHHVWATVKRILREAHGVDWLSPREMNPGQHFD
jgi:hypothetical protein